MISDFDSINQFDVLPQKVVIRNPVSEEGILSVINLSFHEILFSIFSNGRSYIFNVFFYHFRFEICRKLGQGTYGKVQLGINKETGQQVCLKFTEYFKNVMIIAGWVRRLIY